MRSAYYIIAAILTASCAQPMTPITKDSPLALQCGNGGFCDRRYEACHGPTGDWPNGYCVTIGDDGRAFGSRKRDPLPTPPKVGDEP